MRRLAILFLLAPLACASTLQVGSGQTYATIGACITAATASDTCNVHTGTYTENPTVSKALILQNNSGDSPAIVGLVDITANTVTVKGFDISPNGACSSYLIHGDGRTALTIQANKTHGCTSGAGIYLRNSTASTISSNESYGNDVGIELISAHASSNNYATGIQVTNNNVHDNTTDGMELHSQYMTISGNTISDNIDVNWASTHPDGIQLLAGAADGFTAVQHALIYNNTIRNHTQNVFSEGTLSGQNSDTIDIWIFNNVLYNTMGTVNGVNMATLGGVDAMLKWSKDVFFYNNTLGDIGTNGNLVHVQDCFNGSVHIENNAEINSVSYGNYVENIADISNGELDYDSYYITGLDAVVWGASFYNTLAAFQAAVPAMEPHGISGNPNVAAFPTPTPNAGSPLIAAGVDLSGLGVTPLNSDKNGNARVAPWTIGAFNASGGVATPVARRR